MKPSLQPFLWICALSVAFLLGRITKRDEPPPTPPSTPPPAEARNSEAGPPGVPRLAVPRESLLPVPADSVRVADSDPTGLPPLIQPLSMAGVEDCLLRGLATNDDLERGLLLAQVMNQVTPDNAEAIARLFEGRGPNFRKGVGFGVAFSTFLRTWGAIDGPAALAYAKQIAEDDYPREQHWVIKGWAEGDPRACYEHLAAEDPGGTFNSSFLRGLLRHDPAIAVPYIEGLQDESLKRSMIFDITVALKADPAALLDWADQTLARGAVDEMYFGDMVQQLARNLDGPGLARVIGRHADSELLTPLVFRRVAETWAKTDAQGALRWVESHAGNPRVNSGAFDVVLSEWARSDPVAAIDWVEDNERVFEQVQHSHAQTCLGIWAEADLEAATTWVEQNLGRGAHPANFTGEIVKQWVKESPEDALDWMDSLPEKNQNWYGAAYNIPLDQSPVLIDWLVAAGNDPRHDAARERLAGRLAGDYPVASLYLAATITRPDRRNPVMVEAARELIQTDPEMVNTWLPNSNLPDRSKVEILLKDPNLNEYLLQEMKR